MTSEHLRPLPGSNNKTTPIISLNHYIFSGIRNKSTKFLEKPSRDDIYKKILIPKDLNKPKFQQKGLIFVWPQKRTSFYYNKEMIWLTWMLAHALYWLHVVDILPTGTGTVRFVAIAYNELVRLQPCPSSSPRGSTNRPCTSPRAGTSSSNRTGSPNTA
jgi:hypothetical protein